MNSSIYRISLDIQNTDSSVCLNAKLGDSARKILITLTDGGRTYRISEGCLAVFTATKPDGAILFNHCTIEDNTIIYEFTGQNANVVGEVKCEVRLYGYDNELITTSRFIMIVDDTVYHDDDVIDSSDEFTTLTEMVTRGNELLNDYETALEQLEDIRDTAVEASEMAREYAESIDPEKIYAEIATKADIFVQPDEPEDSTVGTLWYDTDEESDPISAADVEMPDGTRLSEQPRLVPITQADYDALVKSGTVDENTLYLIKEE